MAFVSITRLRIRSLRFLPGFALYTQQALAQVRKAEGFLGGSLLRDRKLTFWTMTAWTDRESMRRYMTSGAHLRAMPKLLDWCDEASVVSWTRAKATAPGWGEADRRMRVEGRPSKVRHPSPDHQALAYRAPRLSQAIPIRPR